MGAAEVLRLPRPRIVHPAPLLAALGLLVLINIARIGEDGWVFHTGTVEPHGVLGSFVALAQGRWNPGLLKFAAVAAGLVLVVAVAYARERWTARRALVVTFLVTGLLVAPGRPGPGRAPRLDGAMVLHERLHVPDRGRRRSRPRRPNPLRPRLPRHGGRPVLQPQRQPTAQPQGARPLRLLPWNGSHLRGLAAPPRTIRRLPLPRPARDARADPGGALLRGAADRASGGRRGARGQPARRAGGVVRDCGCAEPLLPRPRVRAREPVAVRLRGGLPRGRGPAEAVRARGDSVLRRHADHEPRRAPKLRARGGRVRRSRRGGRTTVSHRVPECALGGHDRLRDR